MPAPRKTRVRYELPGTARFLTFSCYQRLPLFQNERINERFVERLTQTAIKHEVATLAWVIMPEHVHLIVSFESSSIANWLSALKRPFAIEVLRRWRQLNAPILARLRDSAGEDHFWQVGGGYDRNVVGDVLRERIHYCHANPVKRGLASTSIDWRWSSARNYASVGESLGPAIAFDLVPRGHQKLF